MATEDPDYIVEIGGQRLAGPEADNPTAAEPVASAAGGRPYISVLFECCQVYQRLYRNRAGAAYEGFCPRCARPLHIRIGPTGSKARFFRAR